MAGHFTAYEGLEAFISTFQDSNYIVIARTEMSASSSQQSDKERDYAMGPDDCKLIVEGYITRLAQFKKTLIPNYITFD